MTQHQTIVILLIMLGIALFFMMREVFCWYFKINSIESLLKDIKELLQEKNKGVAKEEEPKEDYTNPAWPFK